MTASCLDKALPDAAGFDSERAAEARAIIAENLRLYAYLLPLHIGKEDTVLFPLTERVLSVREQEMLGEEFGRLAATPRRTATIDDYHRLAHELATPPAEE